MSTRASRLLAVTAIAFAMGNAIAASAPKYAVTDLGDIPGGYDLSFAADINDQGWVTGIAHGEFGRRAFLWTPQTGMQDIGSLGDGTHESIGTHINNQGQIIGWSFAGSSSHVHSYVWSQSGGMLDLGQTNANAINNQGTMAGNQLIAPGQAARALPTGFSAYAINDHEQLAGIMQVNNATHAFLLDGGRLNDLGVLSTANPWSYVYDMNEHADVVGVSSLYGASEHAVLWRNQKLIDLGDFSGGTDSSRAMGINNDGVIVGYGTTGGANLGLVRAAMWDPNGTMLNLNDLISPDSGWALVEATSVNQSGSIVGWGINPLGLTRAFVLTAVPEPSTYMLFLFGCLAMWSVRRHGAR